MSRRIKEFNKTSDTAEQRLANSKSELKKAQKKVLFVFCFEVCCACSASIADFGFCNSC